jgi:hypothetical protein
MGLSAEQATAANWPNDSLQILQCHTSAPSGIAFIVVHGHSEYLRKEKP